MTQAVCSMTLREGVIPQTLTLANPTGAFCVVSPDGVVKIDFAGAQQAFDTEPSYGNIAWAIAAALIAVRDRTWVPMAAAE